MVKVVAKEDNTLSALAKVLVKNKETLEPGEPAAIREKMDELMARRKTSQPLECPSAGSTFKRPEGYYAAALIDQCGLKGLTVGGAQVSEKHAGNVIDASAESGMDHEGWKAIEAALSAAHPDAACVPFLFSAGTDTKHYKDIVQATYRFSCLPQSQEDLKGVHGDNERVRLADLDRCAVFYRALEESL